jgi:hypothetical protein
MTLIPFNTTSYVIGLLTHIDVPAMSTTERYNYWLFDIRHIPTVTMSVTDHTACVNYLTFRKHP